MFCMFLRVYLFIFLMFIVSTREAKVNQFLNKD